jgi:hypothetical protein
MPFVTTSAHGKSFKQLWLGIWRKYSAVPFVSSPRRTVKPVIEQGLVNLLHDLDSSLGKAAQYLRALDQDVYNRMRIGHQLLAKVAVARVNELAHPEKHKKWFQSDLSRLNTSTYRMGGLGSMLAVSVATGNGTGFHYDEGDHGMCVTFSSYKGTYANLHYSPLLFYYCCA